MINKPVCRTSRAYCEPSNMKCNLNPAALGLRPDDQRDNGVSKEGPRRQKDIKLNGSPLN